MFIDNIVVLSANNMASGTKGLPRNEERPTRPIPFLRSTSREPLAAEPEPATTAATLPDCIWRRYRSRDNRKGRHTVVISPQSAANYGVSHPHATDTFKAALPGISRMVSMFPVFDVSYDVAIIFTLGGLFPPLTRGTIPHSTRASSR